MSGGYSNREFGALGERLAVEYLKKKRYKILEKNYKNKLGEIDVIARDGEEIVFIEVKTRPASPYLGGAVAVDARKQLHILRTAALYLSAKKPKLQPRFDVLELEVDRTSGKLVRVSHYENAFSQTEDYARF